MSRLHPLDIETLAAHGVRAPAPETLAEDLRSTPAAEPLYQTSVFDFASLEAWEGPLAGVGGYSYARHGLPNARSLELTVAALEGAEAGLATSSGQAALACAVLACAQAGDRVLVQQDAYGGTIALFAEDFRRLGVRFDLVDAYDPRAVGRALETPARLLVVETLSNPLVRRVEVLELSQACRAHGTLLLVDNTFATPILFRPLEQGADAVVHSATKFLGGHHDLCAGLLLGQEDFIQKARGVARRFGNVAAPMDAWLACRGLRTLALRVQRAEENAQKLAARLRTHARVSAVHYPELGAVLSFDVGSLEAAARFVRRLGLVTLTPSLGGVTSSISHSATSSHRALPAETRRALGIGDGLLRLSVGIEAAEDIWRDLAKALEG
jgi:cystathionine beta-lyase/cystathionine gamma-synthase